MPNERSDIKAVPPVNAVDAAKLDALTREVQHAHDHPEHPPVDGGYRGNGPCDCDETVGFDHTSTPPCAHCRRCGHSWPLVRPEPGSFAAEALAGVSAASTVGRDTARELGAYVERRAASALPTDSAERKSIPLCAGAIDYFPDMFYDAVESLNLGLDEEWSTDDNAILQYLANREYADLFGACLDALQDELVGPPTQCRSKNAAVRWSAALVEIARVSVYGNEKHNPGQPLHHARGKSMDHADCIARHTWDRAAGVLFDGPMRHSACRAWRAGALGQEAAEAEGAPLARGARLP